LVDAVEWLSVHVQLSEARLFFATILTVRATGNLALLFAAAHRAGA